MSSGDVEQNYYNYITDYVKNELDNNFETSIDSVDNNILYNYSNAVMDRICNNVIGIDKNEKVHDCIFNEVFLATQIGFVLNSATKRFALEDPENGEFVEKKKAHKIKYTLKEKFIIFLLKILNKNIKVIG